MDTWQKHVAGKIAAFTNQDFEHTAKEPTISLNKREAYICMKALEAQEKTENPLVEVEHE